ncbi:hypothetical protein LRR81_07555 [Metabacillus sp. GX 13764]|uniref:hypothetical protein n=1 Tax=Metabacillus kandeliae TaxID=2900151 RepID=UPI001E35B700|nr:hypothetical protein [Metabacillus kandeliae]MCD7034085.1 hypothetical protein [Metabacillus kandeliae]
MILVWTVNILCGATLMYAFLRFSPLPRLEKMYSWLLANILLQQTLIVFEMNLGMVSMTKSPWSILALYAIALFVYTPFFALVAGKLLQQGQSIWLKLMTVLGASIVLSLLDELLNVTNFIVFKKWSLSFSLFRHLGIFLILVVLLKFFRFLENHERDPVR